MQDGGKFAWYWMKSGTETDPMFYQYRVMTLVYRIAKIHSDVRDVVTVRVK